MKRWIIPGLRGGGVLFVLGLAWLVAGAHGQLTGAASAQPAGPLTGQVATGDALVEHLGLAEWMGPLAPIALSPYFGLACLSGTALLAEHGVLPKQAWLGAHAKLANPAVFGVLLALALFTSLPRLTKVSKTLVHLADPLETYAGFIAYAVVLWLAKSGDPSPMVAVAGLAAVPMDVLVLVAAWLNFFVVNTVRVFFELLVLISPIPLLDALFEAANKALVVGLMTLYAFSPTLAMAANLLILFLCLLIFRVATRRMHYYRHLLVGVFRSWRRGDQEAGDAATLPLTVFPLTEVGAIDNHVRCRLEKRDGGLCLVQPRRFRSPVVEMLPADSAPAIDRGLLAHQLKWSGEAEIRLAFSRETDGQLDRLADALGATRPTRSEGPGFFGLFTRENRVAVRVECGR